MKRTSLRLFFVEPRRSSGTGPSVIIQFYQKVWAPLTIAIIFIYKIIGKQKQLHFDL